MFSEHHRTDFDRDLQVGSILETLGGPGVVQVFIHSPTSLSNLDIIAPIAPGFHKYDQRALVFAREGDVVAMGGRAEESYLRFLRGLGLSPREENIVPASGEGYPGYGIPLADTLASNPQVLGKIKKLVGGGKKVALNPFIPTSKEFTLAAVMSRLLGDEVGLPGGSPGAVDRANRKDLVREKAARLGIPIPAGEIVELDPGEDGRPRDLSPVGRAVDRQLKKTGRVIIKGSVGSSGSSLMRADGNRESIELALRWVGSRADNRIYLVEALHEVTVSPNLVFYIDPDGGRTTLVGVSDQRLYPNLVHAGNIYPPDSAFLGEMIASALKMTEAFRADGLSGFVGYDFVEHPLKGEGKSGYFLAEVNAKINGSCYPRAMMEHLNRRQGLDGGPFIEAFLTAFIRTELPSFADLDRSFGHLFFDPVTARGVVPYNTGCLPEGRFALAVFGPSRDDVIGQYESFLELVS